MPDSASGIEQFAVSRNGVLAYVAGERTVVKRRIVMADRKGVFTTVTADASAYEDLALSPDGREIAMTVEGPSWNIWVYHIDRGTLTRLTFDNDNRDPLWTPDGRRVVYTSLRNGLYGLYWRAADGSGPEELLMSGKNWRFGTSGHPDGRFLSFDEQDPKTGMDLWILPVGGGRKPYPFVNTSFREWFGEFSRDGRWIAYESNESGRSEIYLRPFPGPGGKWQVSTPRRDPARMVPRRKGAVLLRSRPADARRPGRHRSFACGRPAGAPLPVQLLRFRALLRSDAGRQTLRAHPKRAAGGPVTQINLVLGWGGELERQMRERSAR